MNVTNTILSGFAPPKSNQNSPPPTDEATSDSSNEDTQSASSTSIEVESTSDSKNATQVPPAQPDQESRSGTDSNSNGTAAAASQTATSQDTTQRQSDVEAETAQDIPKVSIGPRVPANLIIAEAVLRTAASNPTGAFTPSFSTSTAIFGTGTPATDGLFAETSTLSHAELDLLTSVYQIVSDPAEIQKIIDKTA